MTMRKLFMVWVLVALLFSAGPGVVMADEPPVEKVPPDIPAEDANWPIIEQWTRTETDPSGTVHTITYTVRQAPAGTEPQATEIGCTSSEGSSLRGPVTPLTTCIYLNYRSLGADHTIQGITQHLKSYYWLYRWLNGVTYSAYVTHKTEEWWTRTSTVYIAGDNQTDWLYHGFDCSNHQQTKHESAGFWPDWYNQTETYHYIYDFTKNWPILTPAPQGVGIMRTLETAPAYNTETGRYIGTLVTQISYSLW